MSEMGRYKRVSKQFCQLFINLFATRNNGWRNSNNVCLLH